jgi:transcriptional regulator with XRE-family HTH domain
MTTLAALVSTQKVYPRGAPVNRLVPMTTRGARLRAFLGTRLGNQPGWLTALVEESGLKRGTIGKWANPKYDGYPELASLAQLAKALGVRLSELVAVIEGEPPPQTVDQETQALIRAVVAEEVQRAVSGRPGRPRG